MQFTEPECKIKHSTYFSFCTVGCCMCSLFCVVFDLFGRVAIVTKVRGCSCSGQFICLFFTTVLSVWDFSFGEFGLLSSWKASWDRVALPGQPTVHAGYVSFSISHRTLTRTTGSLTYAQVFMYAVADGVYGRRVCLHWELTGRNIPCRTGEIESASAARRPTLYHLSYIPTPAYSSQPWRERADCTENVTVKPPNTVT